MPVARAAPLVFPATARHTATVIFVHGLGDTGHGWSSAVENWRLRQRLQEVKFILPHAPAIPVTANMGRRMPGWYDFPSFDTFDGTVESLVRVEDEAGILKSRDYFHDLVQKEVDSGIPAERVVLGGFSQGGAMSLFSGLTAKARLGGIVVLSGYLLLNSRFAAEFAPKPQPNQHTPIFMAHGADDIIVNAKAGQMTHDVLKGLGYNVSMKIYPGMGHSACPEELDDVEAFLRERLPTLGDKSDGGKEEL